MHKHNGDHGVEWLSIAAKREVLSIQNHCHCYSLLPPKKQGTVQVYHSGSRSDEPYILLFRGLGPGCNGVPGVGYDVKHVCSTQLIRAGETKEYDYNHRCENIAVSRENDGVNWVYYPVTPHANVPYNLEAILSQGIKKDPIRYGQCKF